MTGASAGSERSRVCLQWELDGLGSSSYGPEAALAVMIPLGAASLSRIDDWNSLPEKAVALALSLSPQVVGIHLAQHSIAPFMRPY